MTASEVPQVAWLVSSYDLREHAFNDVTEGAGYLQAMCDHCVPPDKVTDQSGSKLQLPRCMACMLIFGDMLGDALGVGDRARSTADGPPDTTNGPRTQH